MCSFSASNSSSLQTKNQKKLLNEIIIQQSSTETQYSPSGLHLQSPKHPQGDGDRPRGIADFGLGFATTTSTLASRLVLRKLYENFSTMQFTPQQLVGGSRFSNQVKIGNWSEDLELETLKLKDYLSKKEDGALLVNAKSKK